MTMAKAAALAWAAAITATGPVEAQAPAGPQPGSQCPAEQGTCREGLLAADLFELANRYAASGALDQAERLLEALATNAERTVRTEAFFRLGNLRTGRGNLSGAAEAYRSALELDPEAARVRLELARILYAKGDEEAARRQLMRAEATGLPEDVARVVNRFSRALRSRRPVGLTLEAGIAPDTNINRATAAQTVEIGPLPLELDEDARARSGIGLILGGQAYARIAATGAVNFLARASAQASLYRETRFNDVGASLVAGPELLLGRARLRPAALVSRRWFGGRTYSSSVGATVNLMKPLGPQTQLDLDATAQSASYRSNAALNGWQFSIAPRVEHALTPSRYGRIGLRLDRSEARDAPFRTWSYGVEALLSQDIGRETVFARAGASRTVGDGAFSIAPARDDKQLDAQLGFLSRRLRIGDLSPGARLNFTSNRSPVFFYDYQRLRLELFLSRDF